jgi:hypothetical protein
MEVAIPPIERPNESFGILGEQKRVLHATNNFVGVQRLRPFAVIVGSRGGKHIEKGGDSLWSSQGVEILRQLNGA